MGSKRDKVTIGYKYFTGLQAVLAQTLDSVIAGRMGGKIFWEGSVTSNSTISVNNPVLHGDEDREGGLVGSIDIEFGGASQPTNSYLASVQSGALSAYRHRVQCVWRQIYHGNTSKPENMEWKGVRTTPEDGFETGLAVIPDPSVTWANINPVHVLRELELRNYLEPPSETIFGSTWSAAAQTIYDEGLGISFKVDLTTEKDAFRRKLQEIIDGVVFRDRATGLWEIALFRDDYTVADLDTWDESDTRFEGIVTPNVKDAPNRLTIKYTSAEKDGRQASVTLWSTARALQVGRVNPLEKTIKYITSRAAASTICQRELVRYSVGPTSGRAYRSGLPTDVKPGSVLILNAPRLGISNMIARVVEINEPGSDGEEIEVQWIEDIYGQGQVVTAGDTSDERVPETAQNASPLYVEEMPYWGITVAINESYTADTARIQSLSGRATGSHINFDWYVDDGDAIYEKTATSDFMENAALVEAIDRMDTTVTLTGGGALFSPSVGDLCVLLDTSQTYPEGAEYVVVDAISGDVVTLGRGALDTVPQDFPSGAYLVHVSAAEHDGQLYAATEDLNIKLRTRNFSEYIALNDATVTARTMSNRADRPYPVAALQMDGEYSSVGIVTGDVEMTWYERNRLTQTSAVPEDFFDATITPESGTTYTPGMRLVYDDDSRGSFYWNSTLETPYASVTVSMDGDDLFNYYDIFDMEDLFQLDWNGDPAVAAVEVGVKSTRENHDNWTTANIHTTPLMSPINLTLYEVA